MITAALEVRNHLWLGGLQAFVDLSPEQLQTVVQTNLTGTLLGTRAALRVMSQQQGGGHVFNIDGAGADGLATPCYAAYGATKAGQYLYVRPSNTVAA